MRPLREALSDESYSGLLGVTDSETIFALLLDRLAATKAKIGDATTLAEATAATLEKVSAVCEGLGIPATLNVGVTDGEAMVFTRYSTTGPGNSLYTLQNGRSAPDALVVASERFDEDPAWQPVPDRHLLAASPGGVALQPL